MGCGPKIVKKCKGETQKAYAWALAGMSGHGSVCILANVLLALPKVHFCQRSRITVSYGIKDNDFRFSTDVSNSEWIRT